MHDDISAAKAPGAAKGASAGAGSPVEKPGGEGNMHAHSHKGGEHDVSDMDIKSVVQEHGPATHIFSEHKDDMHHVHSVHGEKHHHSEHASHDEAHEQMGQAMGAGTDAYGGKETPDEENAEQEQGSGVPGLSS